MHLFSKQSLSGQDKEEGAACKHGPRNSKATAGAFTRLKTALPRHQNPCKKSCPQGKGAPFPHKMFKSDITGVFRNWLSFKAQAFWHSPQRNLVCAPSAHALRLTLSKLNNTRLPLFRYEALCRVSPTLQPEHELAADAITSPTVRGAASASDIVVSPW